MRTLLVLLGAFLAVMRMTAAQPALTVYNQNFAIVRETVPLQLKPGVNSVEFTGVTSQIEPESVLLRDPAGKLFPGALARLVESDRLQSQHGQLLAAVLVCQTQIAGAGIEA